MTSGEAALQGSRLWLSACTSWLLSKAFMAYCFVGMAFVSCSSESPLEGIMYLFQFLLITLPCYMSHSRCWCCLAGTDSNASGSGRFESKVPVSAAGSPQGCLSSPASEGKLDTGKHAPAQKPAGSAKVAVSPKSGDKRKALEASISPESSVKRQCLEL